ncbi:MAG: CoA transferase [Pseudomonadota bacterium]
MQAFDGIRVLDLTHVLAGPFATYQLAVLGADVIKIEPPGQGDMNRQVGPVHELNAARMGAHFQSQAANKRSLALDLKSAEGKEVFLALAMTADVIVENYRTGSMAGMGLGYRDIAAQKPDIIYCSITGFGQTGPKAKDPAFDNVIQAWSGMMEETGPADGDPVIMGPPVLDYGTGAQAAFAIAASLLRRERTGEGQWIDVAMLDAALAMQSCFALNTAATGQPPARSAMQGGWVAGYGCYHTKQGILALGVFTPAQHKTLFEALNREDLAAEVAAYTIADMPARQAKDHAVLTEAFAGETAQHWEDHLTTAGVPAARVRVLDETLASAQVAARRALTSFPSSDLGGTLRPAMAAFMCNQDGPAADRAPPRFGEHGEDILSELGYTAQQIADLSAKGII